MDRPPTLQALALRARDSFGEDGYPFEDSIPSSLDVVVAAYAEAAHSGYGASHAGTTLRRHLESRGCAVAQGGIDEFVDAALIYLRAVYPHVRALRDADERRMLSHLFWGNLVAARSAMGAQDRVPAGATHSQSKPAVVQTLTCSCGDELTSADDEEFYRFARAHTGLQHAAAPERPLRPAAVTSMAGTGTQEAIVQRWQDEVVNGGDLAAIDALSAAGPADALKAQVTQLRDAFPDLRSTVNEVVVATSSVAVRSTLEGTHQGAFRGVAPTGRRVSVASYEFFRIQDAKIVDRWGGVEEARLLQQLGVLP